MWAIIHRSSIAATVLLLASASAATAVPPEVEELIGRLRNDDVNVRYAAWRAAHEVGAPAVAPIADLLASDNRGTARAAAEALRAITHHAGRPGADEERAAVEAELIKVLDADRPADVRARACDLLSLIGGTASVAPLAALLADEAVREPARRALQRIPGTAATEALIEALTDADDAFKPAIINALGQRKAARAVDALVDAVESGNRTVALAAAQALAHIGEPPSRAFQAAALQDLSRTERAQIAHLFLRYADRRAEKGDTEAAMNIYRRLLDASTDEHLRCAAVTGMPKVGAAALPDILPALGDESRAVRAAASAALLGMKGDDVDTQLEERMGTAYGATKAALLRILAGRASARVPALLRDATKDEIEAVRVVAYELLGGVSDPSVEPIVLKAAESGPDAVRSVALRSYLRLAGTRLGKGDKEAALAMFHRALDLARADEARNEALQGVAAIASADSIERVERAMILGSTAEAACLAYIRIAARIGRDGDKDRAETMITEAVGKSGSSPVSDAALRELRSLGIDTTAFAKKAGFLTDWWLIGPFPNPDRSAYGKKFFPEEAKVDLEAGGTLGDKTLQWKKLAVDAVPARIDLTKHFETTANVAIYGYAEFDSATERKINVRIGTDDGCEVWLNGERIHGTQRDRGFTLDQDTINAWLEEGRNKLLVKVLNSGGGWELCVRITDRQNRPIDLTASSSQ